MNHNRATRKFVLSSRGAIAAGLVIVLLVVATRLVLNSYTDSSDTGVQNIFERIDVNVPLDRFLSDFAFLNDTYGVTAYETPGQDSSSEPGGKLAADRLDDLEDLIDDGAVNSSTFSGLLVLVRQWLSQNLAIRLYFENGRLVKKELGPRWLDY